MHKADFLLSRSRSVTTSLLSQLPSRCPTGHGAISQALLLHTVCTGCKSVYTGRSLSPLFSMMLCFLCLLRYCGPFYPYRWRGCLSCPIHLLPASAFKNCFLVVIDVMRGTELARYSHNSASNRATTAIPTAWSSYSQRYIVGRR